ncbi:segregation and condensation protein A [Naasia lichenicola]|uniref:Segregation and condensation protein A n=1 Tax=Naasia lichenicola TaxID=2565933 RepID=A0A4S4FNZ2_9MICO|nr:ScpA family protein [Naasia lichenicola]THG32253.1 segregation/condensation protein A [Naasia lichenicola]
MTLDLAVAASDPTPGFSVKVAGFDGPFDLLLSLIAKHQLEITEISLSVITDEFLGYLHQLNDDESGGGPDQLDEASEFLVVAATLLDLKLVGLLPQGELVDAEDVALLEARDLLFARLLQYRAFKEMSGWFAESLLRETSRHYRSVKLEERFRAPAPDLVWTAGLAEFAAFATLALTPRETPTVALEHLHAPKVSIREQAATVVAMLRGGDAGTFRELVSGEENPVVIARFLAILELYRAGALAFDQLEPLGELSLRWTASTWDDAHLDNLGADYDD